MAVAMIHHATVIIIWIVLTNALVVVTDEFSLGLAFAWTLLFIGHESWALGKKGEIQNAIWATAAFALLLILSTLLLNGFAGLELHYVPVAGMFVAGLFASGMLSASYGRRLGVIYAVYVLLLVISYLLLKAMGSFYLPALLAVHVPSGLIVVLVPALAAIRGLRALWLTSIGGALISIAGMSLAALAFGRPMIPADLLLSLVAPIVLLSTILMTSGLMLTKKWIGLE